MSVANKTDLHVPRFLGGLALGMVARRFLYCASNSESGFQAWSVVYFIIY